MANLSVDQLRPCPTGRAFFANASPGSKLPGYDHLVPSGQNAFPRPIHKIDATSIPTAASRRELQSEYSLGGLKSYATNTRRERFEDEDDDAYENDYRKNHAASESRTVSAVCPQNLRIASASRASVATVSEGGWSAAKTQFFTPTCTDASDK
jgi:hypothetical protein